MHATQGCNRSIQLASNHYLNGRRVPVNNYVSSELKESIQEELKEWESQVNNKLGGKPIIETNLEDYEKYFDNENVKKD
jgi:hypothetical protein